MNKSQDNGVIVWLVSGCLLVIIMVVIGGITRLTHSGLSMVQWSLFMGSIPPLSQEDWEKVFDLYKLTPEFHLRNYHFTLEEFRSIFWWEYVHRMIGRLIGLVFIGPFFYFLFKRRFSKPFLRKLFVLLGLGVFQGFMGWYMVKSGLVKNPDVSHYRLASHLIIAFFLYGFTFWLMLEKVYGEIKVKSSNGVLVKTTKALLLLLTVQIIYGAFVSGLKAGAIYNSFPKMGDAWIAESVTFAFQKNGFISLLENHASVQFVHRSLAYLIVFLVILLWRITSKISLSDSQNMALKLVYMAVCVQVILGVFTLIYAVPIALGILHQFGALLLFTSVIYFLFKINRED